MPNTPRKIEEQLKELKKRVTELEQGENAQFYLAALVESADDAIIGKTLDGVITSWNRGAENLFGYTASEAIGKPVTILHPPKNAEEEPRILARIRRGERLEHYETQRVCKDGGIVEVSLTVSPILDQSGKIIGASKIVRDITERKKSERLQEEALNEAREA